jgi:molybdenum cofactor biosynthesis enzyme
MDIKTFEQIFHDQITRCTNILITKAKEYATDDRLHNFKVAAELEGCSVRQALAGMMAKHTVSIYDMCKSLEESPLALWNEKITDHMNYLILLSAVVEEESQK